jgi:hypothetical protein
MTGADLATAADVATLAAELRELRAAVQAIADRLPSTWIPLTEAAHRLGVDPRTITAMASRGEIRIRRCGRRIAVDPASLAGPSQAEVAQAARGARS